jgi:hypothetical protein
MCRLRRRGGVGATGLKEELKTLTTVKSNMGARLALCPCALTEMWNWTVWVFCPHSLRLVRVCFTGQPPEFVPSRWCGPVTTSQPFFADGGLPAVGCLQSTLASHNPQTRNSCRRCVAPPLSHLWTVVGVVNSHRIPVLQPCRRLQHRNSEPNVSASGSPGPLMTHRCVLLTTNSGRHRCWLAAADNSWVGVYIHRYSG